MPPNGSSSASAKRVGHKKSRMGCFQCKRRKIKCQETRPACENCIEKDYPCQYPSRVVYRMANPVVKCVDPSPTNVVSLRGTPTTFTMEDLQLFHHFMIKAYPHLPLGNTAVWLRDVPKFAHHKPFLMHSILALAASHLTLTTEGDYTAAAYAHRVTAVNGLNEALSKPVATPIEADAMLATCYALTFQSSYIADGLGEFLTMVRGCALVTTRIIRGLVNTTFNCKPENHINIMESKLVDEPAPNTAAADRAAISLEAIRPWCEGNLEGLLLRRLDSVVGAMYKSMRLAYWCFINLYTLFHQIPQSMFPRFIDPSNSALQILLGHFIALQLELGSSVLILELDQADSHTPIGGTLGWLDHIYGALPVEMRPYLEWPLSVQHRVRQYLSLMKMSTHGHIIGSRTEPAWFRPKTP